MPKLFLKARDPLSCYSHFIGMVLSFVGILVMIINIFFKHFNGVPQITGLIFCLSMTGLYAASSLYHYSCGSESTIEKLRKLDHSMIYVLIAGSYTPILYSILPAPKNIIFLIAIWLIAAIGIVLKLCIANIPRWVSTGMYVMMGWFIAIDFPALRELDKNALFLLILGGISYTIGGAVYGLKKPNISKLFGFHEIFHVFVLLGSLCHYVMVLLII